MPSRITGKAGGKRRSRLGLAGVGLALVGVVLAGCSVAARDAAALGPEDVLVSGGPGQPAAALDGTSVWGTVYVSVDANNSVTQVAFVLDPASSAAALKTDAERPFDLVLDVTQLAPGEHSLRVDALTKNGKPQQKFSLTVTFTVDPATANGPNQAPRVDAGTDLTVTAPGPARLAAVVTDDGLPGGTLTLAWTGASGPGGVSFDDAHAAVTNASFAAPGTYVLDLRASDGALEASDTLTVTVVPDAASCLDTHDGPLMAMSGSYPDGYEEHGLDPEVRFDNADARFVAPYPGSNHPTDPFTLEDTPRPCISGGLYSPGIPDDEPDWEKYHHSQGIYLKYADRPVVEGVAMVETGDGIRFTEGTPDWTFRDTYIQHAGDDAIENDFLYSGTVDDILVDWANVFLSCRLASGDRGLGYAPGGTVIVRNSLVALRPQLGGYDGPNTGGKFFKWESQDTPGCKLELSNNVFLAVEGDFSNLYLDPADHKGIDYDVLTSSSNNVIVWLGSGDYPAPIPPGFTLTRDVGVWNAARSAWFDRHPEFEAYR